MLKIFDISEFHDTRGGTGLLGEIQSQVAKDVTVSGNSQFIEEEKEVKNPETLKNYIFFLS